MIENVKSPHNFKEEKAQLINENVLIEEK